MAKKPDPSAPKGRVKPGTPSKLLKGKVFGYHGKYVWKTTFDAQTKAREAAKKGSSLVKRTTSAITKTTKNALAKAPKGEIIKINPTDSPIVKAAKRAYNAGKRTRSVINKIYEAGKTTRKNVDTVYKAGKDARKVHDRIVKGGKEVVKGAYEGGKDTKRAVNRLKPGGKIVKSKGGKITRYKKAPSKMVKSPGGKLAIRQVETAKSKLNKYKSKTFKTPTVKGDPTKGQKFAKVPKARKTRLDKIKSKVTGTTKKAKNVAKRNLNKIKGTGITEKLNIGKRYASKPGNLQKSKQLHNYLRNLTMGGKGTNILKRGVKGGGNIAANLIIGDLADKATTASTNFLFRNINKAIDKTKGKSDKTGLNMTEMMKRIKPSAYGLPGKDMSFREQKAFTKKLIEQHRINTGGGTKDERMQYQYKGNVKGIPTDKDRSDIEQENQLNKLLANKNNKSGGSTTKVSENKSTNKTVVKSGGQGNQQRNQSKSETPYWQSPRFSDKSKKKTKKKYTARDRMRAKNEAIHGKDRNDKVYNYNKEWQKARKEGKLKEFKKKYPSLRAYKWPK